ncbi:YciI family protein [Falsiroseomonas oryzae]|uniref:YciI family protein n=1 Tax=Falsiroseomonas oryzae TaxID=2766473 RepID=UPI0022EB3C91|nr:YciI family protein [Roseomonas sp. MO-31]
MQVMLLIYSDETAWAALSGADKAAAFAAYGAYTDALREAGAMVAGAPLQPTGTAHTVRVQSGTPQVLDGPYAETREQLGGYYLIEVPDMQAALRWAARCPGAAHGTVEVRPLMPMPAMAPA